MSSSLVDEFLQDDDLTSHVQDIKSGIVSKGSNDAGSKRTAVLQKQSLQELKKKYNFYDDDDDESSSSSYSNEEEED